MSWTSGQGQSVGLETQTSVSGHKYCEQDTAGEHDQFQMSRLNKYLMFTNDPYHYLRITSIVQHLWIQMISAVAAAVVAVVLDARTSVRRS